MMSYKCTLLRTLLRTLLPITTAIAMLTSSIVYADIALDNDQSTVSFVSIKKGTAGEAHTFKKVSGLLSDSGELKIVIDLASVDTKVEIRDTRMKRDLFETSKFAEATLTAKVDAMTEDGVKNISTDATLDLHGVSKTVLVHATVVKNGDSIVATSTKPIIIDAAAFGLDGGIAKLKELAKLPSIATAVPVNFVLVFSK
ncbi:MAG: YceI family protein [Thiotrichaceae bacterium]